MTPALFRLIRYENFALLMMRVALGALIAWHGWPYFRGGPDVWAELGHAISVVGITYQYPFWGFMAATSQFFGGIFVVAGLFTRIWSFFISFSLYVAALAQFSTGEGLRGASQPLELAVVFGALVILGSGRFSLDDKLFG